MLHQARLLEEMQVRGRARGHHIVGCRCTVKRFGSDSGMPDDLNSPIVEVGADRRWQGAVRQAAVAPDRLRRLWAVVQRNLLEDRDGRAFLQSCSRRRPPSPSHGSNVTRIQQADQRRGGLGSNRCRQYLKAVPTVAWNRTENAEVEESEARSTSLHDRVGDKDIGARTQQRDGAAQDGKTRRPSSRSLEGRILNCLETTTGIIAARPVCCS